MTNPSFFPAPRPLLFLDVDGPLIPFGGTREQYPDGYPTYAPARRPRVAVSEANPLLSRIDPSLGSRLGALGCELVWATSWLGEANECVAPWLGLAALPVVSWPESESESELDSGSGAPHGMRGVHWKTAPLVEWAAGRDFVWLDDEVTDADRDWVAEHHRGRALLHRVDPRHGLGDGDLGVVGAWLSDRLRAGGGWSRSSPRP
ncbi:HAD domain-containing protein [Streptomyces geranii]|uniref:HAD domain-containing protein n=1 Tax=Streptomyces geranii TaxID=2058923 RepID=UPI000D031BD7|nr:HAD domain-containing protein [Streptomyces geranii]